MSAKTTPTVHNNGTSAEELAAQLSEAKYRLDAAEIAIAACSPNGRDYYTQGATAFPAAIAAHKSRLSRIRSVIEEIELIQESIASQCE